MTPLIKICGITRPEDLELCEALGVDFVGLNFAAISPRCISLGQARHLLAFSHHCKPVGIFAEESMEYIQEIVSALALPFVQLHGSHISDPVGFPATVIRAFRRVPYRQTIRSFQEKGDYVMLDGKANGVLADWNAIVELPADVRHQIFLAGGLDATNVGKAIEMIEPFAVDVASGVEREPGVKDHEKVRAFVAAVQDSQNTRVSPFDTVSRVTLSSPVPERSDRYRAYRRVTGRPTQGDTLSSFSDSLL